MRHLSVAMMVLVTWLGCVNGLSAQDAAKEPEYSEAFKEAYGAAINHFNQNQLDEALKKLEEAEKLQSGLSETLNLRGAILVRMKKLEEAAATFQKLVQQDPKNPIPVFNLGESFFLQKKYAESKKHFQAFLAMPDTSTNALGQYKVFLCDLMLGNKAEVDKTINSLRPSPVSPLYYFVNSAVNFKAGNTEEARGYVASAFNIYPGGMNSAFADSFIELGWLTQEEVGQVGVVDAAALKSLSQENAPSQATNAGGASGPLSLDALLPDLDGKSPKKN
ncbi:MAG: tetratricopeptide repeat protein [Blastochloris sp.]|nr:tetratricopeptide repeat protein [Blastochloris sp.]